MKCVCFALPNFMFCWPASLYNLVHKASLVHNFYDMRTCNFKLSTCSRITSTKCHINTVVSPDDGHIVARNIFCFFCFLWRCGPTRAMASSFLRFLDHTQRRITVGRTPLDDWSARRRDLYLTTHNTHNRKTSMPPVGFEPTISASERP